MFRQFALYADREKGCERAVSNCRARSQLVRCGDGLLRDAPFVSLRVRVGTSVMRGSTIQRDWSDERNG